MKGKIAAQNVTSQQIFSVKLNQHHVCCHHVKEIKSMS